MKNIAAAGARIPALGLGTYRLDDGAAERVVCEALKAGVRHVDTASFYGNEAGVGAGLKRSGIARGEVFVTTKIWPDEFREQDFQCAAEASLRRLNTDYVDLLLLHWPSAAVPIGETLSAMGRLVHAGKVRFAGVSNFTRAQFTEAKSASTVPIITNQVEYHPYLDQRPMLNFLRKHDTALTAYAPLAHGRIFSDETITAIADEYQASPAQIILSWLLAQDGVVAIPKTKNAARLAENLQSLHIALSADDILQINALARPDGRLISPAGLAPDWD